MNKKQPLSESSMITRREAGKLAGVALAGGSLLSAFAEANLRLTGTNPFDDDECMPCNAEKYRGKDHPVVFKFAAFWLMLTTLDWENCITKDGWLSDLAELLDVEKSFLDEMCKSYTLNKSHFQRVQEQFANFVADSAVYGRPPCPGGWTIKQIADLSGKRPWNWKPTCLTEVKKKK
jgi:hypothetical protein